MKNNLSKTIGQRLQMIRLQKNLTQEQMGEELNLSTSAYCKIEYGETDLTLTRLYRIAEIMELTPLASSKRSAVKTAGHRGTRWMTCTKW